ncbi:MAG: hypothetical protein V9G10_12685 [Candidatus Nanopelagicales bacterium]
MSESQERMCAVVDARTTSTRSWRSASKWDVDGHRHRRGHRRRPAASSTGTARSSWTCRRARSPTTGPVYERPFARPEWQDDVQRRRRETLPRPATADDLRETLLATAAAARTCASKAWVTDQYDRYVRGNTVLAQPEDAGMLRIDEETGRGVAMATDCNGALRRARSLRRRATGAGRGLPQRRRDRCGAAGRHQLPELRLPGGSRR